MVGFREHPVYSRHQPKFVLRPALPGALQEGQVYSVRGLTFRGVRFDVMYEVQALGRDGEQRLTVRVEDSTAVSVKGSQHSQKRRQVAVVGVRNAGEEVHVTVSDGAFSASLQ